MSLAGLDHAFEYCFGRYQACPVYFQMLIERRARRGETVTLPHSANPNAVVQLTIHRDVLKQAHARSGDNTTHANAA